MTQARREEKSAVQCVAGSIAAVHGLIAIVGIVLVPLIVVGHRDAIGIELYFLSAELVAVGVDNVKRDTGLVVTSGVCDEFVGGRCRMDVPEKSASGEDLETGMNLLAGPIGSVGEVALGSRTFEVEDGEDLIVDGGQSWRHVTYCRYVGGHLL